MATPASGAISMLDMRTEITRGAGAVSMSELRDRYGGSGAISFADLRKAEGFVITSAQLNTKFVTYTGWSPGSPLGVTFGSITPTESNNRVQFSTASFLSGVASFGGVTATVYISPTNAGSANGDAVTAGFKSTDINRVVIANISRTINAAVSNSTQSTTTIDYTMPSSGTLNGLIKFTI
jgi:hypothetical protein